MKKLLYILLSILPFQLQAQSAIDEVVWATELWPKYTDSADAMYNRLFSNAFQRQGMTLYILEVPFKRSILMVNNGTADFSGGIPLDKELNPHHIQAPFPIISTPIAAYFRKSKFKREEVTLKLLKTSNVTATALIGQELNLDNTRVINRKKQGLQMLIKDRTDFYLETLGQMLVVISENKGVAKNFNEADYDLKIVGSGNAYMIAANNDKGKKVMQAYIEGTKKIYHDGLLTEIYQNAGHETPPLVVEYMK